MVSLPLRTKLPRILLAECDYETRSLLKHTLERAAYTVAECNCRSELQRTLNAHRDEVARPFRSVALQPAAARRRRCTHHFTIFSDVMTTLRLL